MSMGTKMETSGKNILIFAPYGAWTVHHQVDAVLGAALQLRGCEVRALVCDGFFESCPIANGDRSCAECFRTARDLFSSFGLPVVQLRSLIRTDDLYECRAWADGLSKEDFLAATFEGAEIGKWVSGCMYASLLTGSINLDDEHVARMNRTLIFNGALLKRAYDRYLGEFVPDHVFCYSGFHPFYRIILRLSREKGLPVVVHERGETRDSFVLLDSESLHESESRLRAWENWKDIPLSQDECLKMKKFCADREGGRDFNVFQNYTFKTEGNDVRERLRIPPHSNIVAVFPTCDWEVGIKKYDIAPTRFERQVDWLAHLSRTVDLDETYLVIRLHPALVRRDVMPAAILKDLFNLSRTMNEKSRVRVIMPYERVTSYSLIQHAAAALTWSSTVGIEALLRGVATASEVYCHKSIAGIEHIHLSDYNQTIINTIKRTERFDLNDLRVAYRGAYYHFFRLNFIFKSFGIRDVYLPDIRIKQLNDLLPGNDATLDHVCDHVMIGTSLYPIPIHDERIRSTQEENAFLESEIEALYKKRAAVKESTWRHQPKADPSLTVLRVQYEGKDHPETVFSQTLKRSRYKNIEQIKMVIPWICDSARFVSALNTALQSATGEFVYLANDNTHVDESLFSSAIDFLEQSKNQDIAGVMSGVWICDGNGDLKGEMFTERKDTNDYAELIRAFSLMERPEHLFSCFVWRMPPLRDLAGSLASSLPASQDVSQAVFEHILFQGHGAKYHKSLIPNVIIHMSPNGNPLRITETGSVHPVKESSPQDPQLKARDVDHDEPINWKEEKLTLLQMNTYYPAFLNEVYDKNRGLEKRPFKEQISIIQGEGFGAIHAFVPHIERWGYSSQFIIANNPHSQLRWAMEHGIQINPKINWLDEVLRIQIESIKPDILLMMDAFQYDSRFVETLTVKPPLIAGWSGEWVPPHVNWSGYDMILSNFRYVLSQAISKGAATARFFHPGFLKSLYDQVRETEPEYDVVFVGQWSDLHRRRNELIAEVAREALQTRKFSIGLYLSGDRSTMPPEVQACYRGECFGLAMHRALRSGRIALNAETTPNLEIVKEAGNMRMFETTGTGVFLLTQYHDNISDYFVPEEEIETFRDTAELMEKIYYYLAHSEKRKSITRRGQQRCLQHYSMEKQLQKLDHLFRTYLTEKDDSRRCVPNPPEPVLDHERAISEKGAVHINISEQNVEILKEIAEKQRFGSWCVNCSGQKIYGHDLLSLYQRAKDVFSECSGGDTTPRLSGIDKKSWAQRQISDELEFWKRPESFEPLEGYPDYPSRLLDITRNMFHDLRTDFKGRTVCEIGGGAYGGLLSLVNAKRKLMID
ncbi:MAG: glycosyltransferase, partial [Deltaproteobacteria bacterium]|nr:glycosyltransferase [Deltaproteobacteria bacterium]